MRLRRAGSTPKETRKITAGFSLKNLDKTWIISHSRSMMKVRSSDVFDKWIEKLRDHRARQRIIARVKRLAEGNPRRC